MKKTSDEIMKNVDHPSHYQSASGKDLIDWCEDFGIMDNAYIFNVFKYLARSGKKDNNSRLQDTMKAKVYLDRYVKHLQESEEKQA